MPKRRVLEKLEIDEISGVDHPCQLHAVVAIMKRAKPGAEKSINHRKELPMNDDAQSYEDLIEAELLAGAPLAVAGQRVLQKYGAQCSPRRVLKTQGATARFMTQVEAVIDETGCSRTAALREARKRYPALFDAYQQA